MDKINKRPTRAVDTHINENEPYMSERMLNYFKRKLLVWHDELAKDSKKGLDHALDTSIREPDHVDSAKLEDDRTLELKTLTREEHILEEIDAALERIKNGTYGYCEETGKPISLARLEAWPIARYTREVEEEHERKGEKP